jgi:hypothetical protein
VDSKTTPQSVRITSLSLNLHHVAHRQPQVLVMPTTLPNKTSSGYRRQSREAAAESGLLAATLFVALAFSVSSSVLPAQLVLPALSGIVVLSGLMLGVVALLMKRIHGPTNERMLDISGVLAMFGFAVAIVCDKTEAMRLLSDLPGL